MEKTSKMIAAAVVLVLCAVAVIGVGYAYTATTVNSGNNASTEYTVIHQDGTGAYQFASGTATIDWNTKDYRTGTGVSPDEYKYKTDFWLDEATGYTEATNTGIKGNYLLKQVGETFTLKTQPQTGGTPKDSLTCAITSSGFDIKTNTVLFLEINNGTSTTYLKWNSTDGAFKSYAGSDWTGAATFAILKDTPDTPDTPATTYKNVTVKVLYGYTGEKASGSEDKDDVITVEHEKGTAPTADLIPSGTPVNNAELTFTITVA